MAEIAFDGPFQDDTYVEEENSWGVDGWTDDKGFYNLLITNPEGAGIAHLATEQCSQLAAALIEHVKEVHDASKKDVT
jgi:hypothetical protein